MTEPQRQDLLSACAFASTFLESARRELRGGEKFHNLPRAAKQLQAALRNLNPEAEDAK